jgi:hypothetical protein
LLASKRRGAALGPAIDGASVAPPPTGSSAASCSPNFAGFLRLLGLFGICASLVARRSESLHVTMLGLGFAGQRSVNHGVLTLCSGGPWDRGNLCPLRPKGSGAGRRAGAKGRASRGGSSIDRVGQGGSRPRAAAMASGLRRSFRTLLRRGDAEMRHPTHFCAVMRHAAPLPDRARWRRPPARTSPRQPYRSASLHANFARIPAT